jgi:hypothetical protein
VSLLFAVPFLWNRRFTILQINTKMNGCSFDEALSNKGFVEDKEGVIKFDVWRVIETGCRRLRSCYSRV